MPCLHFPSPTPVDVEDTALVQKAPLGNQKGEETPPSITPHWDFKDYKLYRNLFCCQDIFHQKNPKPKENQTAISSLLKPTATRLS